MILRIEYKIIQNLNILLKSRLGIHVSRHGSLCGLM